MQKVAIIHFPISFLAQIKFSNLIVLIRKNYYKVFNAKNIGVSAC